MKKKCGSITVMMSLTGLIILALLGTCIETARLTACAGSGAERLGVGVDALLTEYSRPLYDHYGLFFIESGGKPYERVISEYIADSFGKIPGSMDFLGGELTGVSVTDKTFAGDDKAKGLMDEITAYMERQMVGDGLGKLLKKFTKFGDADADAEQIEKTVDEQKEDKRLDERILRLMRLVDGVRVSARGGISVGSYFAKKFATVKDFNGADFGVLDGTVWRAMKPRISKATVTWNDMGSSFLTTLDKVIEKTKEAIEEGRKLRADYAKGAHSDMAGRIIDGLSSLDGNLRVLNETKKIIHNTEYKKKKKKKLLKELWKDYDTVSLSFDYTGAGEAGGGESPVDSFGSALGDGILGLVCEDPEAISDKGVKKADGYAAYYGSETAKGEDYSKRCDAFVENEEVRLGGAMQDVGKYALEELMLDNYITKVFPGYASADDSWDHALDYGWEYVVSGRKSDKANLESVISRILMLRVTTDFLAIIADGAKRAEAYAAAAAVVGFTGLTFLIRFTQTLFLITWAFVEGLTDVAALLLGKHVPIVKTSKQIKTGFAELFLITNAAIVGRARTYDAAKSSSFGYREYVCMFMAMTPRETRLYRVMDLIDMDMKKNGYKGFKIGKCVFDMRVSANYTFPVKLFGMPIISGMIGRSLKGYSYECIVRRGYL